MFGRLKFGRVGRQEEKLDTIGGFQIGFAMPTGVVQDENDDAITTRPGLLGESRQQGFEERLRDAVGNVPEAFAGRGRDEGRDVEPFEAMVTVTPFSRVLISASG